MSCKNRWIVVALFLLALASLGARKPEFISRSAAARMSPRAPAAFTTIDLTQGLTPELLVQHLLGPGMIVSNVTFSGVPTAAGEFQGGLPIVGFDSGVVLSSGCITNIIGPNVSDSISCDNASPGDAELAALSGFTTFDATVLEFDFEPADPGSTTLLFSYVFTSDEYNEFVTTQYNDVFAFFVNGQNCALVPSVGPTPDPVTINTVNNGNPYGGGNGTNPLLYRNNDLDDGGGAIDTEMDGLTVALSCQAAIVPEQTNHIKLAIADASDGIYDSNVLIRAGSFTSTDLSVTLTPASAVNPVGTAHTVTATVVNAGGVPQPGHEIFFEVTSGPNAGAVGTCSVHLDCATDANGQVSFTYTGGPNPGIDLIRACFDDVGGNENCSPSVLKQWVLPCGPDGTPCGNPPAECEYQDTCLADVCHHNGFLPPGAVCRPVASVCDLPELCTGSSAQCPLDQHAPDGTACDDSDACTANDGCAAGVCAGVPGTPPPEAGDGVRVTQDAGTSLIRWDPPAGATATDLLRGELSALPVGPGGADEVCLGSGIPVATFRDGASPPAGSGYWYLVRGVNGCGSGPYGHATQNGVPTIPETSATCP